jgi:hypothetical protein
MANGSNGKADDESRAKKRRAPPSQKLTGSSSSAAVRNFFARDKLLVGTLSGWAGTKRREVRSSTTMSSDGIILPRSEELGEQHPILGSSRSTLTSNGDHHHRTTSSGGAQGIGKAEVAPSTTSLLLGLSPSVLVNMYLCGGYTAGVDDLAGVDLLALVQEHNSALNFPQKVRS